MAQLKANLPGLNDLAGTPGDDVVVTAIDPATGAATSLVSNTLVVKDVPNGFTPEAVSDTIVFQQGFATTEIFQFAATDANHDSIGLDQDLFPGQTIQQVLNSAV